MNFNKLDFYRKQIKKNSLLENAILVECDVEFAYDDEILEDNLQYLLEGGKSNYEIQPFAMDASGGVYVILNYEYIGYITRGECGIIAKNIRDFFTLISNCKMLYDYFREGVFENKASFINRYHEINGKVEDIKNKEILDVFIKKNKFESDPERLYKIFKEAIMIEPSFIIEPTKDGYEYSDDLFGTQQGYYIDQLRKKAIDLHEW